MKDAFIISLLAVLAMYLWKDGHQEIALAFLAAEWFYFGWLMHKEIK